jgi:hypothetical protein
MDWTAIQRGDSWRIERPDRSTVLSIDKGTIPTPEDLPKIIAAPALFQAIDELLAEIDAGHVGRLTAREGMKAYEESFGTSLARAALALARAPSARGEG